MKRLTTAAVLFVFAGFVLAGTSTGNAPLAPKIAFVAAPSPTPSATPSPTPAPVVTSQESPDGSTTATLTRTGDVTTLAVKNTVIYTAHTGSVTVLSLPANTWSPNNKYLFIKEVNPVVTTYLVMKGDGTPFGKDLPSLDVASYFAANYPGATITEVTGWASPYLLVVNIKNAAGAKQSLWFDITSHHFIPLAEYFN